MTTIQFNIFSATDAQHPTNNPIQGATITFSQNGSTVATATTNASGWAVISVPVGDYNVVVSATGFNTLAFVYGVDLTDKIETLYTGYAPPTPPASPTSAIPLMLILAGIGATWAIYYMWKGGR